MMYTSTISIGNRRVIGQQKAKDQLQHALHSDRVSHAYLFTGPTGIGKTALALSFAEVLLGIDHYTDLKGEAKTKKSSWFTHPDIHLFIPMPSKFETKEYNGRIELLSKDPYEIVDFGLRPSITGTDSGNKQAFYPIEYYREKIRPTAFKKPNEGARTVVVITSIELMRAETANAFLKLLEEPNPQVMFLLTTNNPDMLLPTIISRCQIVHCTPLHPSEIEEGLQTSDGFTEDEARYLARVSGGNYSLTRFFNIEDLRERRDQIVHFLRGSFTADPAIVLDLAEEWHRSNNIEGLQSILSLMSMFVRDLIIYRQTKNESYLTNIDQLTVIQKFIQSLEKARLDDMLNEIEQTKIILRQNINPRLSFIVLSQRFAYLLRGLECAIPEHQSWKHLPAIM